MRFVLLTFRHIKKERHYFANKGPSSQIYGFSSSHLWMWELDYKESWTLKNWCFWTVVLEKTLGNPLDCKEIQPVHSEGDQPWDFFGRNDAKAETPVLWSPHAKSWLIGKDSNAGRDWGQEEKGMTEDEMAGWHHWLDGRESEWTPGVGHGQGGLACCDSWSRKVLDTTEWLIWSDQVDFLSLSLLFGLVGIYLVPLTTGYFFAFSSCLYFCVWGGLSIFWQFLEFSLLWFPCLWVGLNRWLVKVS